MKPFIRILDYYIPTYGLLMVLGIALGLLLFYFTAKKRGIDGVDSFALGMLTLIFALLGARILYILTDFKNIMTLFARGNWTKILNQLFFGGMVFYGGVLSGFIAFVLIAKHYSNPILDAMDAAAPAIALGHAFGRLGCFSVGCCYGIKSETLGMIFKQSPVAPNGVMLLPVQLMEAVFNLLLTAYLLIVFNKGRRGVAASNYLLIYSAWRFSIEFFRGDNYRGFFLNLSTSQWISMLLFSLGLLLLFFARGKNQAVKKKA